MAVTARVEVLPESEPVANLLLRHATVSGAARAPVGRADPKDGESWNWGNRSRRPCIALSHFCYRRRKTLAPQGPRKLPKLDVAGSTPVARSLSEVDSYSGSPTSRNATAKASRVSGFTNPANSKKGRARKVGSSSTSR